MGRGQKVTKLSDAPEFTPGAGTYEVKSEFNKIEGQRIVNDVDENQQEMQRIEAYVPWNQKGNHFGNGVRTEKKDPQYPGPGTYEYKSAFKLRNKQQDREKTGIGSKTTAKEEGLGPGSYVVKETSMAPCFSFGVKMGGEVKDTGLKVPKHLRWTRSEKPAPGSHEAPSSIKQNNRVHYSTQECTW